MALVFHDKRGRHRQCNMTTGSRLNLHLVCALLYLTSHHISTHAFLLINYPTPPGQSNAPNNNLGGLLPNGYNLAASNSMPANQLQLPSTLNQQQQQQQQDNQYSPAGQQQDVYGSDAGPQQVAGQQQQQQQQPTANSQYSPPVSSGGRASRERDLPNENPYVPLDRDPIFRFHVSALNSTAAKLVWSLRSGAVADLFELRYGAIPDNIDAFTVKLNGSARDLTVGSLQPGEMYEFRLQGYYGGGGGVESGGRGPNTWRPRVQLIQIPPLNEDFSQQQAQIKQSLLDNRDIMPLGVKAEAKSNQSIQLNWTEQERPVNLQKSKRVNVIRYYVVSGPNTTVSGQDATPASAQQANSSAPTQPPRYHYLNITADSARGEIRENRVVIQKLRPATEYAFAVRSAYYSPDLKKLFTSSGFSMDTLAKTHDLEPSGVRNFSITPLPLSQAEQAAGAESGKPVMPTVELTWAPPESPNGPIRAYWILFATDLATPDDKWALIQINDTTSNFWQVGNLKPGLSYYFKMRALNQRGPGPDSQTRVFTTPPAQKLVGPNAGAGAGTGGGSPSGTLAGGPPPIPANNILMLIVICLIAILFVLFLVVSRLFCRTRSSSAKRQVNRKSSNQQHLQVGPSGDFSSAQGVPKLNGFGPSGNSSTVSARMGTLARRARPTDANKQQPGGNPDYWISAMEQQQAAIAAQTADVKSQMSEKSNSDINMAAMVSIQRDSPQQFTTQTTQLAPMLAGPEYRFAAAAAAAEQQQQLIMQQMHQQQQSHYHTGHHALGYDQMDGATASAFMTLSKRQQQQLLKYGQMQPFSSAGQTGGGGGVQAPSPHQQPPPPPPLNIEQQQQQQQQQQPLYGTHGGGGHLNSTRSLRIHRPPLSYDPVSGSFVQQNHQQQAQQQETLPPNYNSHLNSMLNGVHHQLASYNQNTPTSGSNTLQFHPSHNHAHQTGTLTSRRSTNTLRSFGGGGGVYGQLGGFAVQPPVVGNQQQQQPGGLLQNHQAVINQLNQPTALPLKHVSAVRPQIMSSLEDQIEMELAEKQAEQQQQQQRQGPPVSMQQQPGADQHSQQQHQQQQT